jgi:catechol 2,3-dioxygenase-like lactoylglutathione lyase family enzyme
MLEAVYDHVSLTVASVDRSVAFYEKLFGFKLMRQDAPNVGPHVDAITGVEGSNVIAAFVTNGNLILEFVEFLEPKSENTVALPMNAIGAPHIAFIVASVNEAYEKFSAEGVHFQSAPICNPHRGTYTCVLRDPDNNPIELRESGALARLS